MSVLRFLRKAIKAVGLLDALIDEFERETASRQAETVKTRDRVSEIYQEASNLMGRDRTKN